MSARHTSWARRTKSRGPKGFQLEVRAQRAPRLLVYTISSILSTFVNCHLLKYVLSISSILIPCPPYLSIWSTFIDILTFHPFHLFSSLLIYFQPFLCRWGLLADRYGLPIRDYWQTVHKICKRSAKILLLADPWCFVQKSNYYRTVQKLRQRTYACHLNQLLFLQVPGT